MAKSPLGITKYVIIGKFETKGYIEKPDLIGSFFGQTEGLIGEDLEFSELQKKGKLGRIEIDIKKKDGKSSGVFTIPTALDKVEVSLVAAAIESITKISHTSGKIKIVEIRDERKERRDAIKKRAEELLKNLKEKLPESSDIAHDVSDKVRVESVKKYEQEVYGGPHIFEEDEIILVEGVADVKNMLKHGYSNVLSFGGSNIPRFIKNISKNKSIIAFLDGDKGGYRELEEIKDTVNIDYYTFAPKGKEVEELNSKEINKAMKNKIKCQKRNSNIINKISKVFKKKVPIVQKEIEKGRDFTNKKIEVFQKDVLYKSKVDNDLKVIKKKIAEIDKDKGKDFIILNKDLRIIRSGKLDYFYRMKNVRNAKYLIIDAIFENTISKKCVDYGVGEVFARKKSSKLLIKNQKVTLFDEIL